MARPEAEDRSEGEKVREREHELEQELGRATGIFARAPSKKTAMQVARWVGAPLIVALVPLFWVVDAAHRAALTTLGRDQGIFQYVAWAVSRGEVDYRDIRDVNGPLIHMIHAALLALGGADEHRFHVLELWGTGIAFAIVGACLPGVVSKKAPSWVERAAWAFAAWVILGAQYQLYMYWNQAQRESFCDWFLLPSLALQFATPARTRRGASLRIGAIAALSTITWFGKPSFALFTIAQLAALLFDSQSPLTKRARSVRFVGGGALGAVLPIAYLFRYGDIGAFLRISLVDVPQVYRFIWAKSVSEILGEDGPLAAATVGIACAAVLLTLVAMRELPRRMLVLALAPLAGLASALVQHKGFGYHFHPLTATTQAGFLAIVIMLWERYRNVPRRRPLGRYVALAAAFGLALDAAYGMKNSPHTRNVWILAGGETPERRQDEEYFATFKTFDFFPWEMRQTADYLSTHTSPDARVQMYGMDPYTLFLAGRRSATPYIYAYDLNADAALEGGWSNRPTEEQDWRIRIARNAHENDMLALLKERRPEAFVFVDHAPLISYQDAWEDFRHCCAESATWVASNYHPARSFGEFHVWMRDDLPGTDVEKMIP